MPPHLVKNLQMIFPIFDKNLGKCLLDTLKVHCIWKIWKMLTLFTFYQLYNETVVNKEDQISHLHLIHFISHIS